MSTVKVENVGNGNEITILKRDLINVEAPGASTRAYNFHICLRVPVLVTVEYTLNNNDINILKRDLVDVEAPGRLLRTFIHILGF